MAYPSDGVTLCLKGGKKIGKYFRRGKMTAHFTARKISTCSDLQKLKNNEVKEIIFRSVSEVITPGLPRYHKKSLNPAFSYGSDQPTLRDGSASWGSDTLERWVSGLSVSEKYGLS